jgi:hypothetical protein
VKFRIKIVKSTEKIPGGLGAKLTGTMEEKHQQIADEHGVSVEEIEAELEKGMEVEMEHTTDEDMAHEIAMDHLLEDPKYYTNLSKIEEKKGKKRKAAQKKRRRAKRRMLVIVKLSLAMMFGLRLMLLVLWSSAERSEPKTGGISPKRKTKNLSFKKKPMARSREIQTIASRTGSMMEVGFKPAESMTASPARNSRAKRQSLIAETPTTERPSPRKRETREPQRKERTTQTQTGRVRQRMYHRRTVERNEHHKRRIRPNY